MDNITTILITDPAACAAMRRCAEYEAASGAAIHQAVVARAMSDIEGFLRFAREERALMPAHHKAREEQADAAIAAVERWLGPAPTVALGETP